VRYFKIIIYLLTLERFQITRKIIGGRWAKYEYCGWLSVSVDDVDFEMMAMNMATEDWK
jgi:hypothetical protein